MKTRFSLLVILFILILPAIADAQKDISTQFHGWVMYFGNHQLTNRLGLHTEYQWRRADGFKEWQQSLLRIGLDYRQNENVLLTVGYGNIVTWPYGDQPVPSRFPEHRIWETLTLTQRQSRVYFNHRFRLEQRWLGNVPAGSTDVQNWIYRNRIRYRFLLNVPLTRKAMEPGAIFLAAYDEVFLQFGPNFGLNYVDQNRLYAALGYVVNGRCNVQAGYLNQFVIKGDARHAENNHTLQIGLTYNLDFRRKQQDKL